MLNTVLNILLRLKFWYIHNALKVFAALTLLSENPDLEQSITLLKDRLPLFTASPYIEVQERATFFEQLIKIFEVLNSKSCDFAMLSFVEILEQFCLQEQRTEGINVGKELAVISADALLPVAAISQSKVPKPPELDYPLELEYLLVHVLVLDSSWSESTSWWASWTSSWC